MIYCQVCGKYSPDGSPYCVHCPPPPGGVIQPDYGQPTQATMSQPFQQPAPAPQPFQQSAPAPQPFQQPVPMSQPFQQPKQMQQSTQKQGFMETVLGEFQPTVKSCLLFMLSMCIPILNLIVFFKAGFGSDAPPIKRSFIRASLIMAAIMVGISIIISIIMGIVGASLLGGLVKSTMPF